MDFVKAELAGVEKEIRICWREIRIEILEPRYTYVDLTSGIAAPQIWAAAFGTRPAAAEKKK